MKQKVYRFCIKHVPQSALCVGFMWAQQCNSARHEVPIPALIGYHKCCTISSNVGTSEPRTYCAPNAATGGAENYVLAAAKNGEPMGKARRVV